MSFEVYVPKTGMRETMPTGTCSIDKAGGMRIHTSDLAALQIKDRFVILLDRATKRIALRAPVTPAEDAASRKIHSVKKVQHFSIATPLRELGIERPQRPVRRELITKDNLIIVAVGSWVDPAKRK